MNGHGWVTPNPDGSKARCGGPAICSECAREKAAAEAAIAARLNDASSAARSGDSTPAETMRRAAQLMRARASGCDPRPRHWHVREIGAPYPQQVESDGNVTLIAECYTDPAHRPYIVEHIASWSPPVVLAVAEWLETEAHMADLRGNSVEGQTFGALKVARAYLGEAAS